MDESDRILLAKLFEGHQLYFVGGYVRDKLYDGRESDDIDFATDMFPAEVIKIAEKNGIKFWFTENSLNHGTITILDKYEVTTFRKDVATDGRNATIEFAATIEEDLSRRDFTINAMAINFFTETLVDPFGGISDLFGGVIRAVGNPEERLKEDTLRTLRAIRFANKFGFRIEYELINTIINTSISNLSVERIREEFMKILETRNSNYLDMILRKVIPEYLVICGLDGGEKHGETVSEHSLMTMEYIMEVSSDPLLAFVGLLHDIGKAYTVNEERLFKTHEDIGAEKIKEIMERMKFSNDEIDYVYIMVKNHMRWHFYNGTNINTTTDKTLRRAIRDLPDSFDKEKMITDLSILTWADSQANLLNNKENYRNYTEREGILVRALRFLMEPEIKVGSGLELNGNDLIEMGFKPSPLFNTILKDVEEKVFNEELTNSKEELKKYVREKYE